MARYLVTFDLGSPIPTRTKYIDDASGPPDGDVDAGTDGVSFGSVLWDGEGLWFCTDATTGFAKWTRIGSVPSLFTDLSVSGALAIDYEDGATQDLTLTGNVTGVTIANALAGEATDIRLVIRQDGTGSRTVTWTGITVSWVGGSAPTLQTGANAVDVIGLLSLDDGTTWLGFHAAGGSSVGALDDLSDVTITTAASGDFLRHNGSAWVDSTIQPSDIQNVGRWVPLMDGNGAVITDGGTGAAVMAFITD